jgi:hypothetical protein
MKHSFLDAEQPDDDRPEVLLVTFTPDWRCDAYWQLDAWG